MSMKPLELIEVGNCPTCNHFPTQFTTEGPRALRLEVDKNLVIRAIMDLRAIAAHPHAMSPEAKAKRLTSITDDLEALIKDR